MPEAVMRGFRDGLQRTVRQRRRSYLHETENFIHTAADREIID